MSAKTSLFTGFAALLLPFLLLISLANANPVPSPYRPILVNRPGCPGNQIVSDINDRFIKTISVSGLPKDVKTYEKLTRGWFGGNFTITDTTPNYPSTKKGVPRSPPGTWAKTRGQFASGLTDNIPKIGAIFEIKPNKNGVNNGGLTDPDKCLEACWIGTYTAKLKKPYGGKPKGFKFKITYEHTLKIREVKGRGYKDWIIDGVNLKMNWHAFFK